MKEEENKGIPASAFEELSDCSGEVPEEESLQAFKPVTYDTQYQKSA